MIVTVVVFARPARFGDPPGNPMLLPKRSLDSHHTAKRAGNQRVRITTHPDVWHHVFEHGPSPGNEHRLPVSHGVDTSQFKPALLRSLTLGHSNECGNTRLAAQQVIASLVQVLALDLITNREQQPRLIHKETEIHLRSEAHSFSGEVLEPAHNRLQVFSRR